MKYIVFILAFFTSAAFASDENPQQTLIKNVRIFDGHNAELKPGPILVENNLIKAIGLSAIAGDGATVIDGGGRIITPGFIDSHTHISLIAPFDQLENCLLYTSPSPRDISGSRMPSSA